MCMRDLKRLQLHALHHCQPLVFDPTDCPLLQHPAGFEAFRFFEHSTVYPVYLRTDLGVTKLIYCLQQVDELSQPQPPIRRFTKVIRRQIMAFLDPGMQILVAIINWQSGDPPKIADRPTQLYCCSLSDTYRLSMCWVDIQRRDQWKDSFDLMTDCALIGRGEDSEWVGSDIRRQTHEIRQRLEGQTSVDLRLISYEIANLFEPKTFSPSDRPLPPNRTVDRTTTDRLYSPFELGSNSLRVQFDEQLLMLLDVNQKMDELVALVNVLLVSMTSHENFENRQLKILMKKCKISVGKQRDTIVVKDPNTIEILFYGLKLEYKSEYQSEYKSEICRKSNNIKIKFVVPDCLIKHGRDSLLTCMLKTLQSVKEGSTKGEDTLNKLKMALCSQMEQVSERNLRTVYKRLENVGSRLICMLKCSPKVLPLLLQKLETDLDQEQLFKSYMDDGQPALLELIESLCSKEYQDNICKSSVLAHFQKEAQKLQSRIPLRLMTKSLSLEDSEVSECLDQIVADEEEACLKLLSMLYWNSSKKESPVLIEQMVDEVVNSGLTVYFIDQHMERDGDITKLFYLSKNELVPLQDFNYEYSNTVTFTFDEEAEPGTFPLTLVVKRSKLLQFYYMSKTIGSQDFTDGYFREYRVQWDQQTRGHSISLLHEFTSVLRSLSTSVYCKLFPNSEEMSWLARRGQNLKKYAANLVISKWEYENLIVPMKMTGIFQLWQMRSSASLENLNSFLRQTIEANEYMASVHVELIAENEQRTLSSWLRKPNESMKSTGTIEQIQYDFSSESSIYLKAVKSDITLEEELSPRIEIQANSVLKIVLKATHYFFDSNFEELAQSNFTLSTSKKFHSADYDIRKRKGTNIKFYQNLEPVINREEKTLTFKILSKMAGDFSLSLGSNERPIFTVRILSSSTISLANCLVCNETITLREIRYNFLEPAYGTKQGMIVDGFENQHEFEAQLKNDVEIDSRLAFYKNILDCRKWSDLGMGSPGKDAMPTHAESSVTGVKVVNNKGKLNFSFLLHDEYWNPLSKQHLKKLCSLINVEYFAVSDSADGCTLQFNISLIPLANGAYIMSIEISPDMDIKNIPLGFRASILYDGELMKFGKIQLESRTFSEEVNLFRTDCINSQPFGKLIVVSRKNLIESIKDTRLDVLRSRMQFTFQGEKAFDAGGPSREFFNLIGDAIQNDKRLLMFKMDFLQKGIIPKFTISPQDLEIIKRIAVLMACSFKYGYFFGHPVNTFIEKMIFDIDLRKDRDILLTLVQAEEQKDHLQQDEMTEKESRNAMALLEALQKRPNGNEYLQALEKLGRSICESFQFGMGLMHSRFLTCFSPASVCYFMAGQREHRAYTPNTLMNHIDFDGVGLEKNKRFFAQSLENMSGVELGQLWKSITGSASIDFIRNLKVKVTFFNRSYSGGRDMMIHTCSCHMELLDCANQETMDFILKANLIMDSRFDIG
jgi:hypothetical protein